MFTGIIEEVGRVKSLADGVLLIAADKVLTDVNLGDSIAVNGICLTVTKFNRREFAADVMPETIKRTGLQELKPGSAVNLERAVAVGTRLGGHIVTGHIDGTGQIIAWREEGNAVLLRVAAEKNILRHIVEKGSVALDGISLTVVSVTDTNFTVSLIPHTRQATDLQHKQVGDTLNIETDILAKYVEKLLAPNDVPTTGSKLTRDFLAAHGF